MSRLVPALAIALSLTLTCVANASIRVEPMVGYSLGSYSAPIEIQNQLIEETGTTSLFGLGARAEYSEIAGAFLIGFDWRYDLGVLNGDSLQTPFDNIPAYTLDYYRFRSGLYTGLQLPYDLHIRLGYAFLDNVGLRHQGAPEYTYSERGHAYFINLSYLSFDTININLDLWIHRYTESGFEPKITPYPDNEEPTLTELSVFVSIPFTFFDTRVTETAASAKENEQ